MRLVLRAAFAILAALLFIGIWQAKLLEQTIWSPIGLPRLVGVIVVYAFVSALIVWRKPRLRLPVISWFDIPVGAAVLATLFGLAAHFPINYSIVWTAVSLGAIAVLFRARKIASVEPTRTAIAAFAVAGLPLALHLLAALTPEASADGLAMHLFIPEWIAYHHRWSFDATHLAWAVMPMNGDWTASIAYLAGGEYAAKTINWLWLVVLCAGIFRVLRNYLPIERAWLGVALFASTPMAYLVTGSLFVENLWALLLFAGFVAVWEGRLIASAILLGAAMATKFGSLALILVLIFVLIWRLRTERRSSGRAFLKPSAQWIALFAVFGCIPYVTAYVITGNPVFPFFNGVFHSPLIDDSTLVDVRFPRGIDWRTLYDATIHSSRYLESQNGSLGFQWLLFLPLAFLAWSRLPAFARVLLCAGVAFAILEFQAYTYLRYAFPAMAILAIPVALTAQEDRIFAYAAGAVFCFNIYFLGASQFQHRDVFLNWFNPAEREAYRQRFLPQRPLIAEVNRIAPGKPVALLAGNQIAGLQGPVYTSTWHTRKFENALKNAKAPEEVLKLIEAFDIKYVIAPVAPGSRRMATGEAEAMLEQCTTTLLEYGAFRLARVSESCRSDARPPLPKGAYDDKDIRIMYRGAWIRDPQFPRTVNHSLTYSDAAGESFRAGFTGSRITWVFTRASNRGLAQVLIDGVEREVVDLYAHDPEWQARKTFDAPGADPHTFEVRVMGQKNARAAGAYVDVDQVIVE